MSTCLIGLGLSVLVVPEARAAGSITAVWANTGEDKVTRDDLRATSGANVLNRVWDGSRISLLGGRNEVVAFNVILEAGSGASGVTVSFDRLTGPGGYEIRSLPASGDGVFSWTQRPIELFYVRYLAIKGLSRLSYQFFDQTYDERQIPKRLRRPYTGEGFGSGTWLDRPDHDKFYPDIAVPLELVPGFTIPAGQNQSIWVDVYIPKGAPPGDYQGTLTVSEAGTPPPPVRSVPVKLTVYNFTLPDTPSSKTMLFYSTENIHRRYLGSQSIPPGSALWAQAQLLRDRHFLMAHRHRLSLIGDPPGNCGMTADQPCPEWIARLNGSLFTGANGYDGPGVGVGNGVYSIGTYGSWSWQSGNEAVMRQHTDAWASWFNQNAPGAEYFLYLADESHNYSQLQTWSQWILSNPGPGRQVRSFATIALPTAGSRVPALDIPASNMETGVASQWQPLADQYTQDARKRFYMYNGRRQGTGSFCIEDDGVALRELAWAQYKKRINRWFYWEATYYNNFQGNTGQTDLFETAQTFGNLTYVDSVRGETGLGYTNGDGVLMYPGTDTLYPASSYGVMFPFASLRLKHWRRGIQDVDYLTLAAAINPGAVQSLVNARVPKALWEYGVTDPSNPTWVRSDISWSINPDDWENAREQLAQIITGTLPPPPPPDTTPPTVTINQAAAQPDPATTSPINFTVVFSEPVNGFTNADIAITGTAGGTKTVVVTGDLSTYNVAVSGMTSGTVIATIAAGAAQDAAGNSNTASTSTDNTVTSETGPATQSPFKGSPFSVPGTFQAEDFDRGGEGVAYHDAVRGNAGGLYRPSEDVDIIFSSGGVGYVVNNFQTGEWLEYTINVSTSGTYRLEARVSSEFTTSRFHIEIDGVDRTGSILVPNTGNWRTFRFVGKGGVALTAGQHILRIHAEQQYFNLDSIRIR